MLSVIIPTLPERKLLFGMQTNKIKELDKDIIILSDDSTEKTIGQKRGELLDQVDTKYVMHIDDDDIIDSSIFVEIKKCLISDPDAVAFKEAQYKYGKFTQIASLGCNDGTEKEMGIVHRNPVRTDLAQKIGFYDLNKREDTIFGFELSFLLNDIKIIDKVLYHYLDNKETDRNKPKLLPCAGEPFELAKQGENIFNYTKYGKIKGN